MNRQTLTVRNPGVERLLAGLPIEVERLEPLRRWSVAMMDSASRWQLAKRRNSLGRR